MKFKKLVSLIMASAMVLSLAACGGNGGKSGNETTAAAGGAQDGTAAAADNGGQTGAKEMMTVGTPKITESFDFYNTTNGYESFSMSQVYDTLVLKDENGGYIPGLADSYEIDDNAQQFTFNLNPNAKWSDGTPVTSADVAWSMEQLKASNYVSYIYEPLLASVECPDDHTVVINLTKPSVSFMEYLANPYYCAILCQAAYEKHGASYGTTVDTIVGSGPYKVTEWKVGESLTFEANPDYYRDAPPISKVKMVVLSDSNSAMMALQTGEIDVYFDDVPGVSRATIEGASNIDLYDWSSATLYCVFFNTQNGMFTDVNMRKAVALAMNKEDFITVGCEGFGQPADYPGDRGNIGDPELHGIWDENYATNIEEAKKLVEAAGNAGKEVVIKTYSTDPYPALATVLQNALTQIGMNAKVEQIERGTFIESVLGKGDFEIQVCRWAAVTDDMDELIYGSLHTDSIGSPGNWSFYQPSAEMDQAIVDAAGETDEAARKALYKQVVETFIDDMVYVPIYYPTSSRAYSNALQIKDGLQKYDYFANYSWK